MPNLLLSFLFLTLTCPILSQSTNESSSLYLPHVMKGISANGEWIVSGQPNDLFHGIGSGSAVFRLDAKIEYTLVGEVQNRDKLMIILVVYLGDAMSTLRGNVQLGEYNKGQMCWRGTAPVVYTSSKVFTTDALVNTTYFLNHTHLEINLISNENTTSTLIITYSPPSFHFYFFFSLVVILIRVMVQFTNDSRIIYQIRPFISYVSVALLTGKLLAWTMLFLPSMCSFIKWYYWILPVLLEAFLAFSEILGVGVFQQSMTNVKERRMFFAGVSAMFLLELVLGSYNWYKIVSILILVPQILLKMKQVSNIVHISQLIIMDFFIINSICVLYSTLPNNFFRGQPSTSTFIITLSLSILQILAMFMPRYKKRIFRVNNEGVEELCSICLEVIRQGSLVVTPCNHGFHKHCLRRWLQMNNLCPLDRNYISAEDMKEELEEQSQILIRNPPRNSADLL